MRAAPKAQRGAAAARRLSVKASRQAVMASTARPARRHRGRRTRSRPRRPAVQAVTEVPGSATAPTAAIPGPLRLRRLTPPPLPCPHQALMDDHHLAQWLSYEVINVYLNMLEQRMQDWGYYSTKQHPWQS